MARVSFTQNIQRHVECPSQEASGETVRECLSKVFEKNPRAKSYVLDEQGALRKHMLIFIDGEQIRDRQQLSDPVRSESEIFIMQALSGGEQS